MSVKCTPLGYFFSLSCDKSLWISACLWFLRSSKSFSLKCIYYTCATFNIDILTRLRSNLLPWRVWKYSLKYSFISLFLLPMTHLGIDWIFSEYTLFSIIEGLFENFSFCQLVGWLVTIQYNFNGKMKTIGLNNSSPELCLGLFFIYMYIYVYTHH